MYYPIRYLVCSRISEMPNLELASTDTGLSEPDVCYEEKAIKITRNAMRYKRDEFK